MNADLTLFRHRLRRLRELDRDDISRAGLTMTLEGWRLFRGDPVKWFRDAPESVGERMLALLDEPF